MALFPGNPMTETLTPFLGSSTSPVSTQTALNNFKAATGAAGTKTITWDGVKLDGTTAPDTPPNITVIKVNKTVGIPLNRFQAAAGVFFEQVYAVSGDGFVDVNPSVAGLFPAFSPSNTFAMFNEKTIDQSFVLPNANTSTPVPAATRGFGAIFLNVQIPNKSSIEYFSGDHSLGKVFVPVGAQGEPEFAGALFPDAVVTRVTLTLGTDVLFTFDGTTTAPGPQMNDPAGGHNLVVTDDFLIATPVQIAPTGSFPPVISGAQGTLGAQPEVKAVVGTPFTGTVATFSDDAANVGPVSYTAVVNWGDGSVTNGSVVPSGLGGFNVVSTHTFSTAGQVPTSVDVQKFEVTGGTTDISLSNTALVTQANTTTALTASPTTTIAGQQALLSVTVAPAQGGTPTGQVTFKDGDTVLGVSPLTVVTTGGTPRRP